MAPATKNAKPVVPSTPPAAPRTNSKRKALIGGGVAVVVLAIAVPKFIGCFQGAEEAPAPAARPAAAPVAAPVEKAAPAPAATDKPAIETSATGDLSLSLAFRWAEFETGDRVLAKVKFTNHSLKPVFLPAANEPDAGLAIVVQDADGIEVRRVVETVKGDQLPRRLLKLASGAEIEIPIAVIAESEAPLAPGTYSAFAELRYDPRLSRLGVPVWKAPNGPISSDPIPLVVKPAAK